MRFEGDAQAARNTLHQMAVNLRSGTSGIKSGYLRLTQDAGGLTLGTNWFRSTTSTQSAVAMVKSLVETGYADNPEAKDKALEALERYLRPMGNNHKLGTQSFVKLVRELEAQRGEQTDNQLDHLQLKADTRLDTAGIKSYKTVSSSQVKEDFVSNWTTANTKSTVTAIALPQSDADKSHASPLFTLPYNFYVDLTSRYGTVQIDGQGQLITDLKKPVATEAERHQVVFDFFKNQLGLDPASKAFQTTATNLLKFTHQGGWSKFALAIPKVAEDAGVPGVRSFIERGKEFNYTFGVDRSDPANPMVKISNNMWVEGFSYIQEDTEGNAIHIPSGLSYLSRFSMQVPLAALAAEDFSPDSITCEPGLEAWVPDVQPTNLS